MFGQILVMHLFHEKKILTQICGNNFMVLKVAPPLIATPEQLDHFLKAITETAEMIHSSGGFWADAVKMMGHAINV